MQAAGVGAGALVSWPKGHPLKLELAAQLRAETTVTVGWIAQRLAMGTRGHLSHLLYKRARAGLQRPSEDQPTLGI